MSRDAGARERRYVSLARRRRLIALITRRRRRIYRRRLHLATLHQSCCHARPPAHQGEPHHTSLSLSVCPVVII